MRTLRLLTVSALVLAPVSAPGIAAAVTPPPVDETALPAARPPAPRVPTTLHDDCVAAAAGTSADTEPGQLRGLDLRAVWALTRAAGQTVAVIDTGVARHRRLPHLVPGGDYVWTQDGTADCDGHGTLVAGIIGAAPDSAHPQGFTGIAPDATILAIRQSSNKFRPIDDPGQSGVGDVDTLAHAVRTAADLGATVVNISSVACVPAEPALDDSALGAALAYAVDVKNVVVVTAAGNVGGPGQCPRQNDPGSQGWDDVVTVVSPAWYDDYVLTVGSVGPDGAASAFSLAGPWVDVAAPGEEIISLAAADDGLVDTAPTASTLAGTSYAAPIVSAIAALVRARFPELTARQVMARIERTAHHPPAGWDPVVGHGTVDALAAVSGPAAQAPQRYSAPQPPPPAGDAAPSAQRPRRTAAQGAALCVAVAAGIAVAARLRRGAGSVPED